MRSFITIAVIVILALTNPGKEDFGKYLQKKTSEAVGDRTGFTGLLAKEPIDVVVGNSTERTNFLLFSVYKTEVLGEKAYHLGILGQFLRIKGE
jgi:Domain of unknown function (DUF4359)